MEYSKKLLLVPEERRQTVDRLSELDEKMDKILKKKGLSEDEKAALYLQVLQKYVTYQLPPVQKSEAESMEKGKEEPIEKKEEEIKDFENEIVRKAPLKYKSHAQDIYRYVKNHLSPQGELVYQNRVVPGTHVVSLINHFLRKLKKPVEGQIVFYNLLKELHLPKMYDVHEKLHEKKLHSTHKIVKPKMYARKRVWLKY